MTRLVVVGDALLDRDLEGTVERLSPDAPAPIVDEPVEHSRPGGAALAAALAAADGREVTLVTALSGDPAGRELAALIAESEVALADLGTSAPTMEKVRVRTAGRSLLRLDRGGGAGRPGPMSVEALAALRRADAVLVSDYGAGLVAEPSVRATLEAVTRRKPVIWDPHRQGTEPVAGLRLATPNTTEARAFAPAVCGDDLASHRRRAAELRTRWRADGIAVTLGALGALYEDGSAAPLTVPARPAFGDVCGAGDRFAATAAGLLGDGALAMEAVEAAVLAASGFVAAGGAGAFRSGAPLAGEEQLAGDIVAHVRARGGTVVATGGCFDLLHAGHVRMLEAARRLGDCLVVLLNSDASVRRLKGADRPLVDEQDRAAVLAALQSVDAVVVFDEDTPVVALEALRPDVFAKGADYADVTLPEAAAMAEWGGEVVILPYVAGRSTTTLIEEARSRAIR